MNEKILCVEDEQLILDDIADELEDNGYEVIKANNGKEAIEILKYDYVDLILSDVMMPLIDGYKLLELVRERLPQHDETPFIYLTAKSSREDEIRAKSLGVDDFIRKPIDYDLLLATLKARLARNRKIKETNESRLKKIYYSMKEDQGFKEPLSISIVAKSHDFVSPIESALNQLGCLVEFISESHLKVRKDSIQQNDLCFMVYSKIVHYYLSGMINQKTTHNRGRTVLMCNGQTDENLKSAFTEQGIGTIIEHPYPPVEIFKTVLDATRNKAR
ncbi:response regulator [Cohaesibacter gelatinilyticus]|uniref:Response regulator receiver domain-containing protein n=1 Tax=Cohaesibacter gelatinilyticus TaxID=372072 RepID=A0A285PD44_9HYPH|nr:response regulator transcription factor [Cohaesibacter gelatinilyticus]SNZ19133.1 Response regulator receiver domain-containing protein [Cohaesibacter gelatinilyticus]HAT86818.1 response regulator [Hyphomicrobiales bacterium]